MAAPVKIGPAHRYLGRQRSELDTFAFVSLKRAQTLKETKMRKTILVLLGSALLATSAIQGAAATERHKAHRAVRAPAPASQQFRNSNAYLPASPTQSDWSSYYANRG